MQRIKNINKYNEIHFKDSAIVGFISVIIPVYKDLKGLNDTLKSLQKQSVSKNHYEIIVANDGSDPKISELCTFYKVKEIKIFPNLGSYNARNKAIEISKGEYLAFTDADVIVPKDWLYNALKLLKNYDYVGGPVYFTLKSKLTSAEKYERLHGFDTKYLFDTNFFCVTANLFIKRIIIENLGGFDSRLKSGGDNEFGNRVHFFSNFKQNFNTSIPVVHPYRNYQEILIKKQRVYKGISDLQMYFPKRYKDIVFSSYFDVIIYSITPPFKHFKDFKLFIFIWWMNVVELFLIFKHIKNKPFFQKNNRISKILNKFSI